MIVYRVTCTDCPWRFEDTDHQRVTEAMEAHAQKEHHTLEFEKVATTTAGGDA